MQPTTETNVTTLPVKQRRVDIGAKFRGRHDGHADTRTGTYWEVLPALDWFHARLQRGILQHAANEKLREKAGRLGIYWPRR
jgi:hypothetical protein